MVSSLCVISVVGAVVAVDEVIATAEMSSALANVTAAVRLERSSAWDLISKVTPDDTVTRHDDPACWFAVAAVNSSVAVAPLPVVPDVNVVVPHPVSVVGVAGDMMVVCGSTRLILSPVLRSVFKEKRYDTEVAAPVLG
jgi:hypothetical protein